MWSTTGAPHQYEKVASDDAEHDNEQISTKRRPLPRWMLVSAGVLAILGVLILIAFLTVPQLSTAVSQHTPNNDAPAAVQDTSEATKSCPIRREWRTLTPNDQQSYISAVLCLLHTTSTLFPSNTAKTAYSDFPWIHSRVGYFTHSSAPFLPWHRYFLHVYETTLREKCGYEGSLVYWDWTLDSDAVEKSPVFDAETGFGGDGEVGGEITVSNTGRCVVDGPFAGVEVEYHDVKYMPHCLSRGFRDLEGNMGHIDGNDIRPESIEEVLSVGEYEQFVTLMESRVHDAIPYGISGDFETFTAPYGTCTH